MTRHIQFIEQTVCCDPSLESFFTTEEILALALKRGFKKAATIPTKDMEQYYFTERTDDLSSATGEIFFLATT